MEWLLKSGMRRSCGFWARGRQASAGTATGCRGPDHRSMMGISTRFRDRPPRRHCEGDKALAVRDKESGTVGGGFPHRQKWDQACIDSCECEGGFENENPGTGNLCFGLRCGWCCLWHAMHVFPEDLHQEHRRRGCESRCFASIFPVACVRPLFVRFVLGWVSSACAVFAY